MRNNLKAARKAAGLTQQQLADKLGIGLRYYQMMEAGARVGRVGLWDKMEKILSAPQQELREDLPGQEDSPS